MCSKAKEATLHFWWLMGRKQDTSRKILVCIFHDLEVSEKNLKDTGEMVNFWEVTLYMSINKSEMDIDKLKHNRVQSAANSTQVAKQLKANSGCAWFHLCNSSDHMLWWKVEKGKTRRKPRRYRAHWDNMMPVARCRCVLWVLSRQSSTFRRAQGIGCCPGQDPWKAHLSDVPLNPDYRTSASPYREEDSATSACGTLQPSKSKQIMKKWYFHVGSMCLSVNFMISICSFMCDLFLLCWQ